MQQAGVEQHLHQRPDAADGDQFGHEMLAARFQIGEHRHALADAGEVVERQLHLAGMGHGQQVQHGVGRAAQGDDHGDGILEGAFGHDVERAQALLEHLHDRGAGAAAILFLGFGNGILGGAVGQAHAQGFDGAGHGVGGVHAAAGTRAGNGAGLDSLEFLVVDALLGVRADGFEDGNDVADCGCPR